MIDERYRSYSHLPYQVANNNINCYYRKLLKYQNYYIGKTKIHLTTRVRKHLSGNSAIFLHVSLCNACNHSTIENFQILPHGDNDFDNKVKEALYIKRQKSLLDKHLHQHGASFLPNVF